jgi:hypothetical protein
VGATGRLWRVSLEPSDWQRLCHRRYLGRSSSRAQPNRADFDDEDSGGKENNIETIPTGLHMHMHTKKKDRDQEREGEWLSSNFDHQVFGFGIF